MAPFNHFGATVTNTFTKVPPPPSKERDVRERNLLRDVLSERAQYKPRDSTSMGRSDQFSSDNSYSDSAVPAGDIQKNRERVVVTRRGNERNRERRSRFSRSLSLDAGSIKGRQNQIGDDLGGKDTPAPLGAGILDGAVSKIDSVVKSAIDPIISSGSPTAVVSIEPSTTNDPIGSEPTTVILPEASEPVVIPVTSTEQVVQPSELPSSAPAIVLPPSSVEVLPTAIPQTTAAASDATTAAAAATPAPVVSGIQSAIIPAVTEANVSPTAVLGGADRVSLSSSRPTGGFGQKAQVGTDLGGDIKEVDSEDPDSDSGDGIDSEDDVDSGDDLDDDDDDKVGLDSSKDSLPDSRLVAFTTIAGIPQSTALAAVGSTTVAYLPSGATSVSQNGGKATESPVSQTAVSNSPSLTPEASHGLIAFGAVGGVLVFSFVLFFLLRLRKTDAFSCLNCCTSRRKTESLASKSLYRSSGIFGASTSQAKSQRGFSAFFSNPVSQIKSDFSFTHGLDKSPSQNQKYYRNSLVQNAAPFGVRSEGETPPQLPTIPPQYQQVVNKQRMSEVSSLSSGFGDAVIDVPESGPTKFVAQKAVTGLPNQQTLGLNLGPRFSWANLPTPHTLGEHRDRETAPTIASGDSTPRFRTVNSWVDHQTDRVLKNESRGEAVPDLPAIPGTYTTGKHQRLPSDDTDAIFRAHPGQEVEIKVGSRIPSAVLTRKLRL